VIHPQLYIPEPLEFEYETSPAAGAGFTVTSPGKQGWVLVSVVGQIVTDGNAANRGITVDVDDGNGVNVVSNGVGGVVVASTTATFSFNPYLGPSAGNVANQIFGGLMPVNVLPGQKLEVNVKNIQVGDQLSGIVLGFLRPPTSSS
jgi:hypothetical protein